MDLFRIVGFGLLYLVVIFVLVRSVYSGNVDTTNMVLNIMTFLFASTLGILIFEIGPENIRNTVSVLFWILAIVIVCLYVYSVGVKGYLQ